MSLTITYDSNFSSYDGLLDYLAYYEDTYVETTHAANMTFADGPSSSLDIGDDTYTETYFGIQVIGSDMANTMTEESDVSFLIEGETVTLEDSSGATYSSDDMLYTGGTPPTHTLAGAIDTLTFGDGAYSSGSLASDLFTIDGLYEAIGNGMLDTDSDGAYDTIIDRESEDYDNLVHDLVYGLMSGDTSTLESILNANDITYVGTSSSETFDSFEGDDTFTGNGGDDTFVFTTDFGDDTITDFSSGDILTFDSSLYSDVSDVLADVLSDGTNTYIEYDSNNIIELSGYTSLSSSDIAIV